MSEGTLEEVLSGAATWCVVHGDCREVLPTLPDKSVAHVITDPPYSMEIYQRAKKNPARADGGVSVSLQALTKGVIGNLEEALAVVAHESGRIVTRWGLVFCDAESLHLWRAGLVASGMRYVRAGCWTKPDPMPQFSGDRPAQGFEICAIVHAAGKMRWNGGGHAALWHHAIAKGESRPDHPCPKPLSLMLDLIEQFTDPGELVIDPFCGSGTTGLACHRLGRRFIGIERDATFRELARSRMQGIAVTRVAGQSSIFDVLGGTP